jgi:hypothetical protein
MMKTLNEIKDKNPFKVPDNYFEEVNRRIISAAADTQPEVRKKGVYRRLRPALAVAASAAVFILLSYTAVKIFSHDNENHWISGISMEELSGSYLYDIDILTLEENADPSALSDNKPFASKTEIIDYLLLENIDLNEIYELL